MRSQISAVLAAIFACWLGLTAFALEFLFLTSIQPPFLEWIIIIVGSTHYFLIPFGMGFLLGMTRGEGIWIGGEAEKLALVALAFCYMPLAGLALLLYAALLFRVGSFFSMMFAVSSLLFLCGPLLLPWFRFILLGAYFGTQWRDGALRSEFFGRWSRGEKEQPDES